MIVSVIAVAFVVVTVLLAVWVVRVRRLFCTARMLSLSMASRSDSVGGVGISILVASPINIGVVISLLDSEYPLSEVVVALNGEQHKNLLSQLKIRYSLGQCSGVGCAIYRSRSRCYRRLVVVVACGITDREMLLDLAARNALYNYLLTAPSQCSLFPFAVGRMAEMIGEQPTASVDCITTTERELTLLSREKWRSGVGHGATQQDMAIIHISEPMMFREPLKREDSLIVERSRYNFWDFLVLVIMKYQKKVLSLRKA